jgi:hypothetical protein
MSADEQARASVAQERIGAPAMGQVTSTPLQYTHLTLDQKTGQMTVHPCKKEKPVGTWSDDGRRGDKNNLNPFCIITALSFKTHS